MTATLRRAPEFSDCERRNSGWIDQDVNAWTSLAYVAVGLAIAREVWRSRLPRSIAAFAFVVVLEGAGSFLYHAEATDLSQALHDVPLAAMVAFIAGWHVGRVVGSPGTVARSAGSRLGVAISCASGRGRHPGRERDRRCRASRSIAVSEFVARRRGLPPVWTAGLLLLVGVALVFWVFGTPTSPVCDSDSWVQPHGVWHLLTALVALVWVDVAVAAVTTGAAAVAAPPWHRPGGRAAGDGPGPRVPPVGRRAGSVVVARRPARADRGQPRQRVRRSDRGGGGAAATAAVPGQGRAVEGRRRTAVARVRRGAARVPVVRRRPIEATTGRCSRPASATSPAARWSPSSRKARPATVPGSTGCAPGRRGSRSARCRWPPTSRSSRSVSRSRARSKPAAGRS